MEMDLPVIKLETRNLTKKFSATEGVADISLQVYEHELLTLLGPSGCGKTTILRAIGGFNKIDSGKILLDGAEVQGLPPEKRPTGMVFQSYNLWPHMTIYENMAFGLKLRKTPKKEMDAQIAEMLALVKMSGSEKKYPTQLSGGQKRRVAIAGVLAMEPEVLILDEPTAGLDPRGRDEILDQIDRLHKERHMTIILVSHSMEDVARYADRLIVMNHGQKVFDGAPKEVFCHYRELETMGLAATQITYLVHDLKENGIDIDDDITTVAEAREAVLALRHKPTESSRDKNV